MVDITLRGTGIEIGKRVAEFKEQHLTVTIHSDTDGATAIGAPEHLRIRDETHLEELLLEGLRSGPGKLVIAETWDDLRKHVIARTSEKNA